MRLTFVVKYCSRKNKCRHFSVFEKNPISKVEKSIFRKSICVKQTKYFSIHNSVKKEILHTPKHKQGTRLKACRENKCNLVFTLKLSVN